MTAVDTRVPRSPADPADPMPTDPTPDIGVDRLDLRTGLHSALFEGTVHHARLDATPHAFSYRVLMAWLALEELPGALDGHPLWSARHPAPVRFRREDFHGPPGVPLADAVRHTIAERTGRWTTGPIRVLAHLRTWGWSFNPITLYLVLTADRSRIDTLLAEVTNTPWHERHAYVFPIDATEQVEPLRFPKALHVSPFLDLDLDHTVAFGPIDGDHLTIRMDDRRGDERVFAATLRLQRRSLDRHTMGRVLRQHPFPAHRVSAGIHLEALRLRLKGAPFRRHPHPPTPVSAASVVPTTRGCPFPSPAPSTRRIP